MTRRHFSLAAWCALWVALLQFALPLLHMAAVGAQQQAVVLCTGTGSRLVFAAGASNPAGDGGAGDGVAVQPCALCAHLALALPPLPAASVSGLARYVPIAEPALAAIPVRAYAFEYPRGRAPPADRA